MTASAWNPNSDLLPQSNATGLLKQERIKGVKGKRAFSLTTFAYAVGTASLLVFKNGENLDRNIDYFEVDETTILLAEPTKDNDYVTIIGMVGITGTATTDTILRGDLIAATGANIVSYSAKESDLVRSTLSKLRDVLSVKDFKDVVGDGIADDTVAVQAAINSGRDLYWGDSSCSYRITSELIFGSTGQTHYGTAALKFDGANTTRLGKVTADDVTFINLNFDGNNKQPRSCLVYIPDNVKRPRFLNVEVKNLTGKNWGSSVLNAMYAFNISPYGVTDFLFEHCIFRNIIKYNDGVNTVPVTPAFVGGGFTGGICFLREDMTEPTAAQPVVTRGTVNACLFDNIQTIRQAGLSDADSIEFNDADAIRTYGYTGGGEQLHILVTNCTFNNVSKRCFKFRAAGSTARNNQCFAAELPYSMTSPIDLTANSIISGFRVFASAARPVYNVVTWSVGPVANANALLEDLDVSHCINAVNFFSNPDKARLENFKLRNSKFSNCKSGGLIQSAPLPDFMSNIALENVQFTGSTDTFRALEIVGANGTYSNSSGFKLDNVYVQNGSVYIGGVDNNVSKLEIEISSNTFNTNSASAALCRIGDQNVGGYQNVENLFVNAWNLKTTFINADRNHLTLLIGDNATFKNVRLKVPEGLNTDYAHINIWGRDISVEGLKFDSPGSVYVGTPTAATDVAITDWVRLGKQGATSTVPFIYSGTAGTTRVLMDGITDFRVTAANTIRLNGGSQFVIYNVASKTTNATVVQHGGLAKVANINTFA